MTKDRIEQLRTGSSAKNCKKQEASQEIDETEENEMTALTIQPSDHVIVTVNTPGKSELVPVCQYVNKINQYIAQFQEEIVQLKRYHVRQQRATKHDSILRKQVDSLDEKIKLTAMQVKTSLMELETEKKGDEGSVFNRVVKTQHFLLAKRFSETLLQYEESLLAHKKICADIIKKQLQKVIEWLQIRKITCVPAEREVTDEQLNEMLESKDPDIFVGDYTEETLEARQALLIVQDRYKEIFKIDHYLLQITIMLLDFTIYDTQQGELIDSIENYIGDGYAKTHRGNKKLYKSQKHMVKARKDLESGLYKALGLLQHPERIMKEKEEVSGVNVQVNNRTEYAQETLEAHQSLEIAQDWHKDIEKSTEQTRAMHLDIALCVTQQGERLDRIENDIYDVYAKIHRGHAELYKAQKHMAKARKKKIWITVFLMSVIGICLLILFI